NPAGSALFNYNHFSLTGNVQIQKNTSIFSNNKSTAKETELALPNFGAVFVIDSKNQEQALKKVTVGLGYHTNARFNDRYFSSGVSNQSVTNYFLDHANNGFNGGRVPLDHVETQGNETIGDLYDILNGVQNGFSAQQAMLAYQGFLINENAAKDGYVLNGSGTNFYQENETYSTGFNNQLTGNIGFDFNKKLYLGANLNVHFVDYLTTSAIYEENLGATTGYQKLLFNNQTYTYGSGFSFNVGGIYKATEDLRIGASYQSPTWMNLQDEFSQSLQTNVIESGKTELLNIDPNLVTLYNKYRIQNPGSFTGSLAYVFGSKGLLSFDYTRKDYSSLEYSAKDGSNFDSVNSYYKNNLQATNEFRIGGEYRLNQVSLRAGFRHADSPYKNKDILGDLTSYSGGIGYSFGAARLDLGYMFWQQDSQQNMISSGTSNVANIQSNNHNITLTYSASF
ncbi:MAG TPA: outer membrane protein transport protein, partial [Flavobacterium sp.]|nr:outer membrane protein transport protein [Flavobacterium sp.]